MLRDARYRVVQFSEMNRADEAFHEGKLSVILPGMKIKPLPYWTPFEQWAFELGRRMALWVTELKSQQI